MEWASRYRVRGGAWGANVIFTVLDGHSCISLKNDMYLEGAKWGVLGASRLAGAVSAAISARVPRGGPARTLVWPGEGSAPVGTLSCSDVIHGEISPFHSLRRRLRAQSGAVDRYDGVGMLLTFESSAEAGSVVPLCGVSEPIDVIHHRSVRHCHDLPLKDVRIVFAGNRFTRGMIFRPYGSGLWSFRRTSVAARPGLWPERPSRDPGEDSATRPWPR